MHRVDEPWLLWIFMRYNLPITLVDPAEPKRVVTASYAGTNCGVFCPLAHRDGVRDQSSFLTRFCSLYPPTAMVEAEGLLLSEINYCNYETLGQHHSTL